MILAALTAGFLLCLGVGVAIGRLSAVVDADSDWSGYRDGLDALERIGVDG